MILNNDRLGFNGAYTGLADTFIGKDSSNTLGIYVTNAGGASSNGIGTTTTKGNLTCAAITASGTITAAGAVIASGGNLPFIVSSTSPADTELQIINSAAGGRIWTLASMGSLGFYGLAPGAFMIFDGTAGITRLSINASGALTVPGVSTHTFGTTNTVAMTAGAIAASGIAPALNITQTGVDSAYDMISVTSYGNNVFKTAVEGFAGNKSRTQFGSSGAANMYIETFQTAAHGVSIGFSNSTPVTLGTGGSSLTLGYYNNIYPGIHTFSGTTTAAGAMIAGTLALNTLYPNPVNGTNIGTNNVQLQFGAANRGFWSNGYSDVYYSANGSNVLGMSVSGLMVNPSMNIGFGTVGNGTFSSLFSEDSTAIKCRADGGFQARNLANSADAPVTCSNLTASGSITTSSIRGVTDATYYNVALTSFGTGAGKVSIYDSAPYIVFREATGGGAYLGMATNFIMENMNSSGAIYMKTRGNFSWLSGVGATLLDITQAGNATLSGDITLTDGQRFRSASNSIRLGNYPEIVVTDTFQIQGSQQRIIFGGSGAYARIESTVPFNFTTLNGAAPQGITASDITVGPGTNVKLWADGNGAVVSQTTGGAMALKVLNGWGVYFDNSLKVHLAGSIAGDGAVQITSNGNLTAKGSITASGTISSPSGGNGTGERFGSGTVVGQYSVAIGNGAGSGQEAGVSIGYMAGMSYSCVGIGYYSNPGWRGVAIGAASSTTSTYGFGGVAIGYSATAVEHSVAIGPSANNSVVNTCLIGSNNVPLSLVIYNGDLSLGSGGSGNVTKYVKAAAPTSSGYGNHLVIQASSANTSGQGGSVYLVPGVGAGGPGAGTIYLGTASSWVGASVSGPLTVTNNGPNTGTALNIIAGGSTGLAIYWDNLTPYMQYSLAEGRQSRFVNSSSYTFDASVQAAANSTKGGLIATDGTTTLQMRVGWAGNYADSGQIWHNGVPRQIISSDGVATVGNVMIVGDYLVRPIDHGNSYMRFTGTGRRITEIVGWDEIRFGINGATNNLDITATGTTIAGNITATGYVTSVIQSLSTDPTGSDLASGETRTIKNTSTGTTKVWLNDGGAFKSLTFV